MRIAATIILMAAMICGNAVAAEAPSAKTQPAPVIVVIDVQRILQESMAAKNVQQQLEAQRAKFQGEISREEKDLRSAEQELKTSQGTVSSDVYSEREQQLRQRFLSVERHVQAKRKALDQAFSDSMGGVKKSLLEVVNTVAKERGVNLVVVKQQTLWSDKSLDVTDEVLGRLNKTLSVVPVKIPGEEKKPNAD
ncbi:MAG: OmpH family outer membrane protein [Alphaproteobacteria bacterium]|nr:OmpH family outer membrane protein [Alphaproteobacteria bacterium]